MILHAVKGGNVYCGPAVISTITGLTTDKAAELLFEARVAIGIRRRRTTSIEGTSCREVVHALEGLGHLVESRRFRCRQITTRNLAWYPLAFVVGPTLAGWMRRTRARRRLDAAYAIVVGTHWVTVCGDQIVDNDQTMPIDFKQWQTMRRSRIKAVYRVFDLPTSQRKFARTFELESRRAASRRQRPDKRHGDETAGRGEHFDS